jgi:hypothetical protein
MSWVWALHCLLGTGVRGPWLVDMLVGLDRQMTHVERHLSYYFSPNTHLTGEALALYVVGTALPELAGSPRWAATGRRVLLDEMDRQILADGGHVERSTHYQRYTLDFYLLATLTARHAGDRDAARRFEDAAGRLADFTRTIAGADGRLPLLGDDDGGMLWPMAGRSCNDVRDSLAVAAAVLNRPGLAAWGVPEEVHWIAGPRTREVIPYPITAAGSRLLRETGYFVARAADDHAVLDVGPHGFRNAGHAHADALSMTLSIDGRPLLIDPGTGTYTMDAALRDRMRSTASHNTVTLDDRPQSIPAGPFHWQSATDARVVACTTSPALDAIEAVHDGYAPARHRRTVVRTAAAGWLVVDVVAGGRGVHRAAAHWHFDPGWRVDHAGTALRATHDAGGAVWMLYAGGTPTLHRGDAGGAGWCAPVYGQLVPASTARIGSESEAPFTFVTWIGNAQHFAAPVMRCTEVNDLAEPAVVVEIVDGPRAAVFVVRATASLRGGVRRVGGFETDAAVLHYVTESGGVLTACGASECTVARVNGHDLPLSSKPATDPLLIHGSDGLPILARNSATDPAAHSGAGFADQ